MTVVTASGSIYVFNFISEPMTVRRIPLLAMPTEDFKSISLRRDGETLTLLLKPDIVIGQPLAMLIRVREDGINTVRTTTPVVSINNPAEPT